jgi:hypothetical protein
MYAIFKKKDSVRVMKRNDPISSIKTRSIRWIARIWGSLIVIFVLLFVIGMTYNIITIGEADPHSEDDIPPIEYSGPILMFLSTVGLAIAWKWEGLGGGLAIGFQVLFLIVLPFQDPISFKMQFLGPLMISLIVMIPGLFYLAYWRMSKIPGNTA